MLGVASTARPAALRTMSIFLPIAQISVNIPLIVSLGGLVGLLSGLFGVGGGFLLTPLLMFVGVSPMVAAGSDSAQIVAASTAGTLAHSRSGTVDYKMGLTMFGGGAFGSVIGVNLLAWLNSIGPANSVIRVLYVVLLAGVGSFMLVESIGTWRRGAYMAERRFRPIRRQTWVDSIPMRVKFPRSEIEISILVPLGMGLLGGILAAMMGVGGGFIMVPLMLYVLRMRMHVVAGTSLLQILFTCMLVTVLQAAENHTVDFVLAFLLAIGSTAGARLGTRLGRRLRAEQLKILLAIIVIGVAGKVSLELVREPNVLLSHLAGH
jgi:uncharacterized protein